MVLTERRGSQGGKGPPDQTPRGPSHGQGLVAEPSEDLRPRSLRGGGRGGRVPPSKSETVS